MSRVWAVNYMGRSAEKLLRQLDKQRAALKEKIDCAMGSASEIASAQEELLVTDWAIAGYKALGGTPPEQLVGGCRLYVAGLENDLCENCGRMWSEHPVGA